MTVARPIRITANRKVAIPAQFSMRAPTEIKGPPTTMRLLPTAQPSLKIGGVLPATSIKIQGSFAGNISI